VGCIRCMPEVGLLVTSDTCVFPDRLQNTMKVKDKELDDARKEVMALKASLYAKDRYIDGKTSAHNATCTHLHNFLARGRRLNSGSQRRQHTPPPVRGSSTTTPPI
jgi:hypothetical protein